MMIASKTMELMIRQNKQGILKMDVEPIPIMMVAPLQLCL
jgi:hypothetical protein